MLATLGLCIIGVLLVIILVMVAMVTVTAGVLAAIRLTKLIKYLQPSWLPEFMVDALHSADVDLEEVGGWEFAAYGSFLICSVVSPWLTIFCASMGLLLYGFFHLATKFMDKHVSWLSPEGRAAFLEFSARAITALTFLATNEIAGESRKGGVLPGPLS